METTPVPSVPLRAAHDEQLGPRRALRRPSRRVRLSGARMLVLDALSAQPEPCTVAAIATILHQHTNTVREHLDGLVTAGFAVRERETPRGPGRPSWLYRAAEETETSAGAAEYAGLASALAEHIARTSADPEGDALAAGKIWGQDLMARELESERESGEASPDAPFAEAQQSVVELLDNLNFAPDPASDGHTVFLRRCPLLEAAYRNPEVVCAVHLGLVRGALTELGASTAGTSLLPFAEKGACHLFFADDDVPATAGMIGTSSVPSPEQDVTGRATGEAEVTEGRP